MKAAVLREINKPLEIEDIAHGDPGPREVLIRTVAAGVCHSDLHFQNGSYPYPLPAVLGHESAGVVEAVGSDVTYVKPGDHVITCLSAFCGHCEYCLTGHMSLCQEPELQRPMEGPQRLSKGDETMWQFLNLSSFAEYMLVHEHAIAKIREDMPMDRAALIGCGVTTGVGAVIHTARVEVGSTVAVIGCGGVGLSKDNDPVEAVRELTGGGVHYSFEAIGLKVTAEQSFKMLARGGTATIIGMIPVGTNIELHGPEFLMERKLQGSNMGSNRFRVDMPRFVELYLQGRLHLDDLISRRIKLEDVNDAMKELEKGEVARSVIMFD